MSDIPRAKVIVDELIDELLAADAGVTPERSIWLCAKLCLARELLDRKKPEFRVAPHVPPMTAWQVEEACRLREAGWGIQQIANHLGTQIGRVSEAINGKRDGV
jgi:hypothetical protein